MKLSRSSARSTIAAALAFVCLFAWVAPAFASMDDPPSGTSTTNPNAGEAEWREGWGNSLYPEFTFSSIPADGETRTIGFLYRIARQPAMPSPVLDEKVGVSWDPAGSMVSHVYDLAGIYNMLPDAERRYVPLPGKVIHDPREGLWSLSVRFYNESKVATRATSHTFGIDLTRPRPVMGFTSGVTRPTESSRRNFVWVNKEYDELSGVHKYKLYINDATNAVKDFPFVDWFPGKLTIEDLQPGVNRVGLQTIDRATNLSSISWTTEVVDPDVPSLGITSPKSGALLKGTQTFSAISTDMAGEPKVTFKIDGVVKATQGKAPYSLTVDTKRLRDGRHILTVTTKDLFGHSRTATRDFHVDNTPIAISSLSAAPNPFYPVLRDGYKDNVSISAHLSETAAELFLQVFDETGGQVREYRRTGVGAGSVTMSWDGRSDAGIVGVGSFWYRFVVKDRTGNVTNGALSSVPLIIRDYEIVRDGPDKVRVVPR